MLGPMTPFLRLLKGSVEKFFGRFYEGPEPPKRLDDLVRGFERANPKAGWAEWREFAQQLAGYAYREGWVRGNEAHARDPDEEAYHRLPPELEADAMDPGWRRYPIGPDLENPREDESDEEEGVPLPHEDPAQPVTNEFDAAVAMLQANIEREARHRKR